MNLEKNIKEIILLYSNQLCVCQGRLRNYLKLYSVSDMLLYLYSLSFYIS